MAWVCATPTCPPARPLLDAVQICPTCNEYNPLPGLERKETRDLLGHQDLVAELSDQLDQERDLNKVLVDMCKKQGKEIKMIRAHLDAAYDLIKLYEKEIQGG